MVEYPVNLDDAPKMEHSMSKRIDKEIGIMRARAARNVRWRRWRMGRDRAGTAVGKIETYEWPLRH